MSNTSKLADLLSRPISPKGTKSTILTAEKVAQLIKEVETQPCLWDFTNVQYQNKLYREMAWKKVAANFYENWWHQWDKTKKKLKCIEVRRKWHSVRDGYRRYLNRIISDPSGNAGKRYIYQDSLDFILPFLFKKNCPSKKSYEAITEALANSEQYYEDNVRGGKDAAAVRSEGNGEGDVVTVDDEDPVDDVGQDDDSVQESQDVFADVTEYEHDSNDDGIFKMKDIKPTFIEIVESKPKIKRKKLDIDVSNEETANQSSSYDINMDADALFLLSFRDDMKVMNRRQKLQFKLGLIKLIQRILDNGNTELPCSSS